MCAELRAAQGAETGRRQREHVGGRRSFNVWHVGCSQFVAATGQNRKSHKWISQNNLANHLRQDGLNQCLKFRMCVLEQGADLNGSAWE